MRRQPLLSLLWCSIMIIVTIIFIPLCLYSADINGTWKAEFETQIGIQKYTFEFKQSETELTGIASSDIGGEKQKVQLIEVKLDSNQISFVEMLPFQGMELRITYQGTVSEDEMKLIRNVSDVVTEELIARRKKPEE